MTNRSINLTPKEFLTFLFSFWQCEFKSGEGFRRGAYICKCAKGYFFPDSEAKEKYFKGYDIEQHVAINNTTSLFKYTCTRCAPGCEECTDRSPCLFTRNVYIKVLVLVLTSFIIILIFIASGIIFRLKESKVRSYTILWQSFQVSVLLYFFPFACRKRVIMSFELRKFAYEKCQDQTCLIIQAFVRLSKTKRIVIFLKTGTFKIIRIIHIYSLC